MTIKLTTTREHRASTSHPIVQMGETSATHPVSRISHNIETHKESGQDTYHPPGKKNEPPAQTNAQPGPPWIHTGQVARKGNDRGKLTNAPYK